MEIGRPRANFAIDGLGCWSDSGQSVERAGYSGFYAGARVKGSVSVAFNGVG
jgi:hypothetical protein